MGRNLAFYLVLLSAAILAGCDFDPVTGADEPTTLQTSSAASEDFLFVSPEGSNSNDCRSRQTPCRTITAAAERARPGQTIRVG